MREDDEVEVRTEQVQVAPSPTCQELKELRVQIAALTTKTEELQTALQQSALAQPPPRVQSVCYWCRKPGHLPIWNVTAELGEDTNNSIASNTYNITHTTVDRDQGGTRQPTEKQRTTIFIPAGKLVVPVAESQATGEMNIVGLTGRCPTVDVHTNGKEVKALVDTGSEVTTVTERWVQENLQHADLLPLTHVTLKAANGLEIPYSGLIFVELELLGQTLQSVPVLVVRDSSDPATRKRKWHVPALVGMNVLVKAGNFLGSLGTVPSALQPALREARLEYTSVRGVARMASQSFIPARSLATIRITGAQKPLRQLLASPLAQPLPGGLLLMPTLVSEDARQRCVRIANLSEEDYILPSRTPVAVLHAIDGAENDKGVQITRACNKMTITVEHSTAEATAPEAVPCPAFDGTDGQRAHLQALLNRYAHRFTKDDDDLGYTDVVKHRVHTTDDAPVAQPYRSIPPNQLQEVKEHIKGLLAQKVIVLCRELQPLRSTRGFGMEKRWKPSIVCGL